MLVVPPKPTGIMHVLGYARRMFSMELQWNAAQCLSSPGFLQLLSPLFPRKSRGSESNTTPKAENSILKTYFGKAWNVGLQGCGQLCGGQKSLATALCLHSGHPGHRGDHQGDKEKREFTCSPTFPGRPRSPGSPCRTREKGTGVTWCQPDPGHNVALCTPIIWAEKCESGKICEKQHLTKPTVTWRIIQSKKHHWHKRGANACCSGVKCPKSSSCCGKITLKEPHWNIRYLLPCGIGPAQSWLLYPKVLKSIRRKDNPNIPRQCCTLILLL